MMNHFDENTIELYVLGSKKVEGTRSEIERHLQECYTCRTIAADLTEFYRGLEREKPQLTSGFDKRVDSIVLRPEIRPLMKPKSFLPTRIWATARAHPTAASVISVGVLGVIMMMLKITTLPQDTNIDHVMLNESLGGLVAYNKAEEVLWQIPQISTSTLISTQSSLGLQYSSIIDLNRNGEKGVLTCLPIPGDGNYRRFVRVFGSDKRLMFEKDFPEPNVDYRGRKYSATFVASASLVLPYPGGQINDILAVLSNQRSPMFVARMNIHGKVVGEMWHYGAVGSEYLVDHDGDGNKELILCGTNDVDEEKTGPSSIMAVLDPKKIAGMTESSATRGFGFEATDCELYYILVPETDISRALDSRLVIKALQPVSENVLRFSAFGAAEGDTQQFEFVFSRDFRLLEVRSSTASALLHSRLKKEGKLSSILDDKYLDNMKRRVKYWNGQNWVSVHTMVNQSSRRSSQK